MQFKIYTTIFCGLALLISGCGKEEKLTRPWSFFPNMHHQESVRPQEEDPRGGDYENRSGRAVRTPVEGTVPVDFSHYNKVKMDPTAADMKNPLPMSTDVLMAGRRAFNIYCMVCHGERGDGDGNIIPNPATPKKSYSGRTYNSDRQMPPPPPLHSERIKGMSDGALFNYITRGGALMPQYNHLNVEMRWSIVNYVRVLYKASHASDEEFEAYEATKSQWVDPTVKEVVHDWRD